MIQVLGIATKTDTQYLLIFMEHVPLQHWYQL